MWENYNNAGEIKFKELFTVLSNLTKEEIKSITQFITIRKLSGRWPYSEIKTGFKKEEDFKEFFKLNIRSFDVIYMQWKEYATRDTTNKERIPKRAKKVSNV